MAQVKRTPHAVAVEFGEERVSYEELNARADRLASHLQGLGVKAESRVGIFVGRGVQMVVGLLGTLKAGGAYVRRIRSYPRERLDRMVEDAELTVVLTQSDLGARWGVPTVELDVWERESSSLALRAAARRRGD